MSQYGVKTVSKRWLTERPGKRELAFSPAQRPKPPDLRKDDKLLLYLKGDRKVVGAMMITGGPRFVRRRAKTGRTRRFTVVPCRTIVLLNDPKRGLNARKRWFRGPRGLEAWMPITVETYAEVLSQIAAKARREWWETSTQAA